MIDLPVGTMASAQCWPPCSVAMCSTRSLIEPRLPSCRTEGSRALCPAIRATVPFFVHAPSVPPGIHTLPSVTSGHDTSDRADNGRGDIHNTGVGGEDGGATIAAEAAGHDTRSPFHNTPEGVGEARSGRGEGIRPQDRIPDRLGFRLAQRRGFRSLPTGQEA